MTWPMDDLTRRFTQPPASAVSRADCPAAERIRLAVRGTLSREEFESVLDHAIACPACTVAWRLVREEILGSGSTGTLRWKPLAPWIPLAAAAAVILMVAGIVSWWPGADRVHSPSYRLTRETVLESLVADDAAMPRNRFLLSWTGGPEGSRYTVRVTDEELTILSEAHGLPDPEFMVPASDIASIPPGGRILWQVEAELPDGYRIVSQTFAARVENESPP